MLNIYHCTVPILLHFKSILLKSSSPLSSQVSNLYSAHSPHQSTGKVPATMCCPFCFSSEWSLFCSLVLRLSVAVDDLDHTQLWKLSHLQWPFHRFPFSFSFYLVFSGCATCTSRHQNVGSSQGFVFQHLFSLQTILPYLALLLVLYPPACSQECSCSLVIFQDLQDCMHSFQSLDLDIRKVEITCLHGTYFMHSLYVIFIITARNPSIWISLFIF